MPVEAYGKVKPGLQIDVAPEIPEGMRYRATVKVVDRLLDSASGTFGVRLELPNPKYELPAGIRCVASFPMIDSAGRQARRPTSEARQTGLKTSGSVTKKQ